MVIDGCQNLKRRIVRRSVHGGLAWPGGDIGGGGGVHTIQDASEREKLSAELIALLYAGTGFRGYY
jgi:hypothetical protein